MTLVELIISIIFALEGFVGIVSDFLSTHCVVIILYQLRSSTTEDELKSKNIYMKSIIIFPNFSLTFGQ